MIVELDIPNLGWLAFAVGIAGWWISGSIEDGLEEIAKAYRETHEPEADE